MTHWHICCIIKCMSYVIYQCEVTFNKNFEQTTIFPNPCSVNVWNIAGIELLLSDYFWLLICAYTVHQNPFLCSKEMYNVKFEGRAKVVIQRYPWYLWGTRRHSEESCSMVHTPALCVIYQVKPCFLRRKSKQKNTSIFRCSLGIWSF